MNQNFGIHKTTVLLVLLASAALVAAIAVAPSAGAKSAFKTCADKVVKVKVDDGEGGKTTVTVPVKKVSVKGASCAKAYQFFADYFSGQNPEAVKGYNCKPASFPVPAGYFGQSCTKGGTTIKYATRGG
jgi:hypothetical protein